MDGKDIITWSTIFGSVTVGIIWVWKKVVKPIIKSFREYNQVRENSLKIQGLRYRVDSIIYLANTPLFEADATGSFISANQAFLDVFGANGDHEVAGYGWINFIVSEERLQTRIEWTEDVSRNDEVKRTITINHGRTGERVVCRLYARLNRDYKNKLINILGNVMVIK